MSSFYDDASLVVIPSGYKTSKVYAEKPTDGSGDLAFTRTGDTATRVNSAGLIEKVRTNLILQSQTFDNASWAKVGVGTGVAPVVTANAGAAPDGTTTADRIVFNTGAGTTSSDRSIFRQSVVLTEGSNGSFYIKSNTGSSQSIGFHNGGQIDTVTATTSWQRFNVNITSSVTFFGLENRGDNATAGTCDVLVWGAQLQNGDIATAYIPTTTAAVSVGPVANVPRLDYLGSTCGKLLLEPQRTNTFQFSEQLDNAYWDYYNTTVIANNSTAPDGNLSADKLLDTTSNSTHFIYKSFTLASDTTFSWFVKSAEYSKCSIENYSDGGKVVFDINNNLVVSSSGNFTNAKIETYAYGFKRISATHTSTVSNKSIGLGLINNSNQDTFIGTGTSGIFVWGSQRELGSYATSYIPTLAASATRGADACSKTGISSLIGQTQGTIFVEEYYDASIANNGGLDDVLVALTDGTTNNLFLILHYGVAAAGYSNVVRFFIRNSNTTQAQFDSAALPTGTYKIALAYKNNDVVGYINGVQVGSDTSATIPATSVVTLVDPVTLNAATKTVRNSQTLLFKTRLTNAELAELTTL